MNDLNSLFESPEKDLFETEEAFNNLEDNGISQNLQFTLTK